MAFSSLRKFNYQNPTSGKQYDVTLLQNADGTVDGKGILLGTDKICSSPEILNTRVSFVVLTAQAGKAFGLERVDRKTTDHLKLAAIFDASNRAGAGALLSTLLV